MKPYQQGHLDGTCGFYAIVNAVRLASLSCGGLSADDCDRLYEALLRAAGRSYGLYNATQEGLSAARLSFLLGKASRHLRRHKGLSLVWHKPFHGRTCSLPQLLDRVVKHQAKGGAVLIGMQGENDEHWTVIRKITARCLILFDSDGSERINLSWIGIAPRKPRSAKYCFLEAYNAYFISCQRDER